MRLRGAVKKVLFGTVPFIRGRFRYYGHTVFFPLGCQTFNRACSEGVYERDIVTLILSVVEAETTYFDVGANIGLLSVPIVSQRRDVNVVSIEASPATLPFLKKTQSASRRCDAWTVIGVAVGANNGETEFWSGGGANGAFDGIRNTGRGGAKRVVHVPLNTLDEIWHDIGDPAVSVIKLDIEGGESEALRGARELLAQERPILIIEWNKTNIAAYGTRPSDLLEISADTAYKAYAWPNMVPMNNESVLKVAMAMTETFVLVPEDRHLGEVVGYSIAAR